MSGILFFTVSESQIDARCMKSGCLFVVEHVWSALSVLLRKIQENNMVNIYTKIQFLSAPAGKI